jgi:hypothetical protein
MTSYLRNVSNDPVRAFDESNKGLAIDGNNAELLRGVAMAEMSLGRWEQSLAHLEQAQSIDPRAVGIAMQRGWTQLYLRRYPQALRAYDEAVELSPRSVRAVQEKAMVLLAQGDLAAARSWISRQRAEVQESDLLAQMGNYWDLMWVFDDAQQRVLLNLPVEAFGGNPAARALVFAQTHALRNEAGSLRRHAEEAERAFSEQEGDSRRSPAHVLHGLALVPRHSEACEGNAATTVPINRDVRQALSSISSRIYMILGEPERRPARPLLSIPIIYQLARDRPQLRPARNPRFEKLLAKDWPGEQSAASITQPKEAFADLASTSRRFHNLIPIKEGR